jgi:hypothetical protein
MHGVMESNSDEVRIFFFHAATTLLLHIIQRITIPKFCILQKSITVHHCMALLQVSLVLIPPHKFVCLPCWYYRLYEIEKYNFRVVPSGITSIPNFMQVYSPIL